MSTLNPCHEENVGGGSYPAFELYLIKWPKMCKYIACETPLMWCLCILSEMSKISTQQRPLLPSGRFDCLMVTGSLFDLPRFCGIGKARAGTLKVVEWREGSHEGITDGWRTRPESEGWSLFRCSLLHSSLCPRVICWSSVVSLSCSKVKLFIVIKLTRFQSIFTVYIAVE